MTALRHDPLLLFAGSRLGSTSPGGPRTESGAYRPSAGPKPYPMPSAGPLPGFAGRGNKRPMHAC
jgi:hypothetical protein